MVFSYKRENRSTKILMVCSSSHLLLQLSDSSAALEGERENLGLGSSHVSKRENVFSSISCFKMNILQIWGEKILSYKGKMLIDFPWESVHWIPPSALPGEVTNAESSQAPKCDSGWFFPVTLTARCFSKITTLYLLVEIYHTRWGFKEADENNTIMQLHFT